MTIFRLALLASLALPAFLLSALQPANAAESYHTCTGFIDSVPTTISTQGVWCLDKNLGTSITNGNAIRINTNNVTIDCNGFKLGGLGAGNGSKAVGISASSRQNITVRHCNVRGFYYGISIAGGAGHLIEDNRLDNNLYIGIRAYGDNIVVQRNRIYDTGGADIGWARGIDVDGEIIDNIVAGLFAYQPGGTLVGIQAGEDGSRVIGNTISGFDMTAVQGGAVSSARGLFTAGHHVRIADNQIHGGGLSPIQGQGIWVNGGDHSSGYCLGNTVGGFTTNILQCDGSDGNLTLP